MPKPKPDQALPVSAVNAACARPGVPWFRSPDGAVSGRNGQACCRTPSGAMRRMRPPGGASVTSWVTRRPGIPAAAIWQRQVPAWPPKIAVELGKGFIQQDGTRLRQEAAHQRHTGTLSARKRLRRATFEIPRAICLRAMCIFDWRSAAGPARHAEEQVLADGHVREEKVVLEQAADAAALPAAGRPESCRSGGWCRRRRTGSRGRPR